MSKSRLFSGKVKKATGAELLPDRNEFLDISQAEPDLGTSEHDNALLVSSLSGTRVWATLTDILTPSNGVTVNPGPEGVVLGFDTSTLVTIATTLVDGANVSLHDLTADGNVVFNGYVVFNNTATYNVTTNTVYTDNLIEIHAPPGGVDSEWTYWDGKDIGLRLHYYDTTTDTDQNAAFVWSHDQQKFEFYATGYEATGTFVGTYGTLKAGALELVDDAHPGYIQFPNGSQQTFAYTGTNINVSSANYATTSGYAVTATSAAVAYSLANTSTTYVGRSVLSEQASTATSAGVAYSLANTGSTYVGRSVLSDSATTATSAATAYSVAGGYVRSITAGTDTAVSTTTGNVTIWDISTLQSVTNRGATTTNAISITNTSSNAFSVSGQGNIGGGFTVGGTLTATNLAITGGIGVPVGGNQNVNQGNIYVGTLQYRDQNILASFQASYNNYTQIIIQNSNAGTKASAEFVVANDLATGQANLNSGVVFGVYGVNSSLYNGVGSLSLPNAVHVYSQGGPLVLGTKLANEIRFVTNSGATDAMIITTGSIVTVTNGVQSTTSTNGALVVQGGAGIRNDLWVGGNINVSGVITATNIFVNNFSVTTATITSGLFSTVGASAPKVTNDNQGAIYYGSLTFTSQGLLETLSYSKNGPVFSIIQNQSNGTNASAEFEVTNDLGNGNHYWGRFGMNSSVYSGNGSLNIPNSVHLIADTGELVIGTTTANGIRFLTNGATADAMIITTSSAVVITSGIPSTTSANGALVVQGGVGIQNDLNVSGIISISNSTQATTTNTGALQVRGGVGIGGNLAVGGGLYAAGTLGTNGQVLVTTGTGLRWSNFNTGSFTGGTITGITFINNPAQSTSTNTGALQVVNGGLGVGGNVNIGGNLNVNGTFTSTNIAITGTFTATNATVTGLLKIPVYTRAQLAVITGVIGDIVAVSDASGSAGGGNSNGQLAFWDTTNNRWSYVRNNNAL